MTTGIKAIETVYKGYRFRSRLEARWAVYFDTLGCEWEYEPEGFTLGDAGSYLPDFWLRTVNMWAEVKPLTIDGKDLQKVNALALLSKTHVLHLVGTPDMKAYDVSFYCEDEHDGPRGMKFDGTPHVEYVNCLLTAEYLHSENRWFWAPSGGEEPCRKAAAAVSAARGARFEFGENGATHRPASARPHGPVHAAISNENAIRRVRESWPAICLQLGTEIVNGRRGSWPGQFIASDGSTVLVGLPQHLIGALGRWHQGRAERLISDVAERPLSIQFVPIGRKHGGR